ncbi:MarR family winged helix-turn-helix transcriptional regulator [Microbacterium sp. NPDC055988]|uniref:MarR family winged helix-turn-helix transcriptional regulator n=1 Tax=Microbacterium sp. NPDC055988 TaxID=3345671 RepID=UPI0035E19E31
MALPNAPVSVPTDAEKAMFEFVDVYDRAYESAAAEVSLSAAQACVLGRLDERRGMTALARDLGCDASNITRIVDRLQRLDYVVREPDPDDGRARLLTRTAKGDEVTARFEDAFVFARDAAERLSTEEQEQLAALLRKAIG